MSYQFGQIDPEERVDLGADEPVAEAPPRRRGLATTVVAVLVMAVFAGGLWFAYVAGTRHTGRQQGGGDVPLIQAETGPAKIKPAQPGGMIIPDRDKTIFNEKAGGPPGEELLAKPEPLLPRPSEPPPAPAIVAPAAPAAGAAAPTVAANPPPVPVAPVTAQPAVPAPAITPTTPVAEHPAPPPRMPAARAAGKPVIPAARNTAAGGHVRIQLGAMRTPDLARREWARLKRANPELLGRLSAVAVRADLGAKGVFYRIQVGPVGDAAVAQRLCRELKERKSGCIIVR